jgi:hypothetical protein
MRLARTAAGVGLVLCLATGAVGSAHANIVTLNPGAKLGYTFGRGFTWGFEISVTWLRPELDWIIGSGAVLDMTWSKGLFELRGGYEMYGPLYGLELGPALVVTDKAYLAIDVTPWLGGVFAAPYLTMSFGIGGPSRTELGTYLKLPICLHDDDGCYKGGSGGDWD